MRRLEMGRGTSIGEGEGGGRLIGEGEGGLIGEGEGGGGVDLRGAR